mmetsp:Transcript_116910/g.363931  ORF Transcript_116910/g.363931 Transcript_116910/m.363931 type:complete len:510 (+) Transcript_116910:88-1617(+)
MPASLLLALLAATGAAADDVSALVQAKVQRHEHRGAVRLSFGPAFEGLGRRLHEAALAVARPGAFSPHLAGAGPEGGLFSKRSIEHEAGGSVAIFVSSNGCASSDAFGKNECSLRWGENVTIGARIRLARGVTKGDKVSLSIASRMQALNSSDLMSYVFKGESTAMGASCDLCTGTCTASTVAKEGNFTLDVTQPTFITNATLCNQLEQSPVTDLDLANITFALPPAPLAAWQLAGDIMTSLEIRGSDGSLKFSAMMENQIVPGSASPAELRAAAPQPPPSLPDQLARSMREMAPALFREASKPAVAASLDRKAKRAAGRGKKISTMVFKLHVDGLESSDGHNVTLTADRGCSAIDSAGSTECRFPLNSSANVTMGMHLSYMAEEGSMSIVKATPKVGGMMGLMMGAFLKPTVTQSPLCGKGLAVFGDKRTEVQAGPCGLYAVSLVAPPMAMLFPDIAGLSLKFEGMPAVLPPTVGDLPPMSVETEVKLRHADGRAIGNFKMEMGLGYA